MCDLCWQASLDRLNYLEANDTEANSLPRQWYLKLPAVVLGLAFGGLFLYGAVSAMFWVSVLVSMALSPRRVHLEADVGVLLAVTLPGLVVFAAIIVTIDRDRRRKAAVSAERYAAADRSRLMRGKSRNHSRLALPGRCEHFECIHGAIWRVRLGSEVRYLCAVHRDAGVRPLQAVATEYHRMSAKERRAYAFSVEPVSS
jgi:hypothetical protein